MRTFEAEISVRHEDLTKALIQVLSNYILSVNQTAPDAMWASCNVIIGGQEREAYVQSLTGDTDEVTEISLRVFGEEKWVITAHLADHQQFVPSTTISVADD